MSEENLLENSSKISFSPLGAANLNFLAGANLHVFVV
jgi:hypothetical protein